MLGGAQLPVVWAEQTNLYGREFPLHIDGYFSACIKLFLCKNQDRNGEGLMYLHVKPQNIHIQYSII